MRSPVGSMVNDAKLDPQYTGGRSEEDAVQLELLLLHLIYELIHINQSFYAPYLRILPSMHSSSSPLYSSVHAGSDEWVPGRLQKHVAGSVLAKEVAKQRALMVRQYDRASKFFFRGKYIDKFAHDKGLI